MGVKILQLEPGLGKLEGKYRQHYLPVDVVQATTGIALWQIPTVVFAFTDYLVLGLSAKFYEIVQIRAAFFFFSLAVFILMRKIHWARLYDLLAFLWGLALCGGIFYITLSTYSNYVQHSVIDMLVLFTIYIILPNTLLYRILPALVFTIANMWHWLLIDPPVGLLTLYILYVCYIMANILCIVFSTRLYTNRRRTFWARAEEVRTIEELRRQAATDTLTGALTRQRFTEMAVSEFQRYKRYQRPAAVIMVDIDNFKNINDTFGHQAGDQALRLFASAVSSQKRQNDIFGRLGGDEFALLLPETNMESAKIIAFRIIQLTNRIKLPQTNGQGELTVSIGLTEIQPQDKSFEMVLSRADGALYSAKHEGRNQVQAD